MFGMESKDLKAKHALLDEIIEMCEDNIASPGKQKREKAAIIVAQPSEEEESLESTESMLKRKLKGDDIREEDDEEMDGEESGKKKAIEGMLDEMSLEELEEFYERMGG